mgnify:CR=1 FL=1
MYIFALKCVFYVLIGLFVPVAAENIKIYRQEFGIKICCLIEVLLPVILWLIFVRQGMLIMNMEHFVLVYFLSIGMMIYSLTAKK